MKKFIVAVAVFFCLPASLFSQRLRISVLTCAPGDELYALFGHTALRITDSVSNTDTIYNYGTFDFDDPDFYTKFVRGKLDYFLSAAPVPDFLYEYQLTHRSVIEQELLLSNSQKQAIADAIARNMQGSNRYYKYDFLYDNCTSRVRDILIRCAGMNVTKPLVPEETSFRNMIHEYLDRGGMPWTKLGIDILLGVKVDKQVTINESMFLPDYLLKGIDSSIHAPGTTFTRKNFLLNTGANDHANTTNGPLLIIAGLCATLLLLSFFKNNTAQKITRTADALLLFLTGSLGCLLLLLWFGTDHISLTSNYNLLWALPPNIIGAFVSPQHRWVKKYFFVSAVLYGLLLASWFWLPQQLNIALAPVVLLLLFTAVRLSKK